MSAWGKWLMPIVVPTGGWVFAWDDLGPGDPDPVPVNTEVTIPAATYGSILELLAALETVIQEEDATASVVISSVGIVTITLTGILDPANLSMDWTSTSNSLSACLGYDESADDFTAAGVLTSSSQHRYGWYPGLISHGTARGEGVAGDGAWRAVDEVGRVLCGNGTMRAIRPDRRRYERLIRYAAIRRTEYIDRYRGVAMLEEFAATTSIRYYPDRDIGTVAAPGTQRDPADNRDEATGYYWLCDLVDDPAIDWNQRHPDICSVAVTVSGRAD